MLGKLTPRLWFTNVPLVLAVLVLCGHVSCDCPLPEHPFPYGTVTALDDFDIEDVTVAEELTILKFTCSEGYSLVGEALVQCEDNEWTSEMPSCTYIRCPKPPYVGNASFVLEQGHASGPFVGSVVRYFCDDGYEMYEPNESTLQCSLDKKTKKTLWEGEVSYCLEKKDCIDPGISPNGERCGDCCSPGSTLRYSCCNDTHELVGDPEITCLRTGNWSSRRPLCRPLLTKYCEFPDSKPHAKLHGTKKGDYFVPGEKAEVWCEPGYKCEGNNNVECGEGGIWTEEFCECKEVFCERPPPMENGKIPEMTGTNKTLFPYGFDIHYVCDEGYRMEGGDSWSMCIKKGVWSGRNLRCEVIRCLDPGTPEHGRRSRSNFSVGSRITFRCDSDYEMLGSGELLCQANGQWAGELTRCDHSGNYCPDPGAPIGGSKNKSKYEKGTKVRFQCDRRTVMHGSEVRECLSDRTWSGTPTKCIEAFCERPPPIENGKIPEMKDSNRTLFPYGFDIHYVCDEGYRVEGGDSWRMCMKKGVWSGRNPRCEVIRCLDPGTPEHGTRSSSDFSVGSRITFGCESDYEMIGSGELQCQASGQWAGELTRCDHSDNYCPDPGAPIGGSKNKSKYEKGTKVRFHCYRGTVMHGSEVRECLSDRTWSGTQTKCIGFYDFDNAAQVRNELLMKLAEYKEQYSIPNRKVINTNFKGRTIIYFAFDMSYNISQDNFAKSVDFAKAIVKQVGVSPFGTRVGAFSLNSIDSEIFLPLAWKTEEEVLAALDTIEHTGGRTSASSALKFINGVIIPIVDAQFPEDEIKSVVLILTDGRANLGRDPRQDADDLKAKGVDIYCIGITGNLAKKVLYDIASKDPQTGDSYVFMLQDYGTMDWLVQEIVHGEASLYDIDNAPQVMNELLIKMAEYKEQSSIPNRKVIDTNFKGRTIIYFVFDVSESIPKDNFAKSVDFAKAIVKQVGVSTIATRVGAVTLASINEMLIPVISETEEEVLASLDIIEHSGGGTSASSALKYIKKGIIPLVKARFTEDEIKSVILILTDGRTNVGSSTTQEADDLKAEGVDIYCIGITGNLATKELYDIASTQTGDSYVFMLQDYGTMAWLVQEIVHGEASIIPFLHGTTASVGKFLPKWKRPRKKLWKRPCGRNRFLPSGRKCHPLETDTKELQLDYSQCGLGKENVGVTNGRRIVGGQAATEPWPWMAALYFTREKGNPHKMLQCGGSIIHPRFILTSGHCMFIGANYAKREEDDITVKIGMVKVTDTEHVRELEVRKIYIHDNFSKETLDYDVALLELKRPIKYSSRHLHICLPPKDIPANSPFYKQGSKVWIAGWGHTRMVPKVPNSAMKTSFILKEIELEVQSQDTCNKSLIDDRRKMTDRMFCAGTEGVSNDTCRGDGGGPVMQQYFNEAGSATWTQVGIVSWGIGCGLKEEYGINTNLHKVMPWVNETIQEAEKWMASSENP